MGQCDERWRFESGNDRCEAAGARIGIAIEVRERVMNAEKLALCIGFGQALYRAMPGVGIGFAGKTDRDLERLRAGSAHAQRQSNGDDNRANAVDAGKSKVVQCAIHQKQISRWLG